MLGGSQPIKGLISAVAGLAIALVGTDARTGIERFTFGGSYLWDGIPLVIVAMGIFAVPEMVDLAPALEQWAGDCRPGAVTGPS